MNKKSLLGIIIGVAILSTLITKAIDRSGGTMNYVIGVVYAIVGERVVK